MKIGVTLFKTSDHFCQPLKFSNNIFFRNTFQSFEEHSDLDLRFQIVVKRISVSALYVNHNSSMENNALDTLFYIFRKNFMFVVFSSLQSHILLAGAINHILLSTTK